MAMGVLKVVLALLGAVQIVVAFLYADAGFQEQQFNLLFGDGQEAYSASSKTLMELLCPLYLGMATVNILSWKMGSNMRPKVAVANIMSMAGVALVHYRHAKSFPAKSVPVWVSIVGAIAVTVGLVLHQMEPGLLTEDKTKSGSKKKT